MTTDEQIMSLKELPSWTLSNDLQNKVNNLTTDTSNDDLKPILQEIYAKQSKNIHKLYQDKEILNNNKKNLDNTFDSKLETHVEQKDSYLTNKRFIEITNNKNKITEFTLYILKISLVVCACLLVFPILYKLKIMNKKITLISWGLCIGLISLIMLYFIYLYNRNKNSTNFNKINFPNPDAGIIAKSKIDLELSDNEKGRCSAYAENQNNQDMKLVNDYDFSEYK